MRAMLGSSEVWEIVVRSLKEGWSALFLSPQQHSVLRCGPKISGQRVNPAWLNDTGSRRGRGLTIDPDEAEDWSGRGGHRSRDSTVLAAEIGGQEQFLVVIRCDPPQRSGREDYMQGQHLRGHPPTSGLDRYRYM